MQFLCMSDSVCVILDSMHAHVCSFHTKDNTFRHDRPDNSISDHLSKCLNRNGIDLIKTAV